MLRANRTQGIERLDALIDSIGYLPLTTPTMRRAARFWASARQRGQPTADPRALDGDMILAAQAALLADEGEDVVVATTNIGHLARFVKASSWPEIMA